MVKNSKKVGSDRASVWCVIFSYVNLHQIRAVFKRMIYTNS